MNMFKVFDTVFQFVVVVALLWPVLLLTFLLGVLLG